MKQIKSDDNGEASLRNIERQASIKEKSWWLEGIPQRPMVGADCGLPAFPFPQLVFGKHLQCSVWKCLAANFLFFRYLVS